jgi:hypothetical protein
MADAFPVLQIDRSVPEYLLRQREWRRNVAWSLSVALLVLAFSFFNLLSMPTQKHVFGTGRSGDVFSFLCVGVFAGELAILSVAIALWATAYWKRFCFHWLAATFLVAGWLIGLEACEPDWFAENWQSGAVVISVLCLMLISAAAQAPLWCFRMLVHLRITRRNRTEKMWGKLSIMDLLTTTTGIAMVAGLLAHLLHMETNPLPKALFDYWYVVAGVLLTICFFSLISIVPSVFCTLWPTDSSTGLLIIGTYVIVIAGCVTSFLAPGARSVHEVGTLLFFPAFLVGYAGVLLGALCMARFHGYRVRMGQSALSSPVSP